MESVRPVSNTRKENFLGKCKFYGRMIFDLQLLTIYRDLKKVLPNFSGEVLDVGCGQSPYFHLLNEPHCNYTGIDIEEASSQFDYNNNSVIYFNGKNIPFENNYFDNIICTEVLEHVFDYQLLVDEMFRVLKDAGTAVITIPWSARFHYIPYDYFRYTPTALQQIFSHFSDFNLKARGNDITVIANKLLIIWIRNILNKNVLLWLFIPVWIFTLPILVIFFLIAHLSLWLKFGSKVDPLGYTVVLKK